MVSDDLEPALSYARISEDPLGMERGVTGQLADNRDAAPRYALRIVSEFHDDDISALRGAPRPGYNALIAALKAGQAKVVVVFQTSRLWRNRSERAEAIGLFGQLGVRIVATKGPHLDFSTAYGRGMAGLLGEFDTMESEVKSERVTGEARRRALEGKANGMVSFGWRREYDQDARGRVIGFRDVVDEHQAAVVREIVDLLLAGKSLKAVTAILNDRGEPAPGGKTWIYSGVRKIALRPANIGRRIYRGEDVGPAAWPPIVDEGRHAQVIALLGDPARITSRSGSRRHMLTYNANLAVCGVCGGELRIGKIRNSPLYQCAAKGCVGRSEPRVDEFVSLVLIDRLSRPDAGALFVHKDDDAQKARDELAEHRARLAAAADDYADGVITREQLARINSRLLPKVERAEAAALRSIPGVGLGLVAALVADPEKTWRGIDDVAQQHEILVSIGMFVRIVPTRQGAGFDSKSVEISWQGPPDPVVPR
ncbi:recombinase family protein [Frankia tisae]|uniref:recombinase family protein n=1 Tax=Frankia tisae TaxID=2950104 RepID=UPI0021C1A344|nr:recombinase family protein [Frankia tisae]